MKTTKLFTLALLALALPLGACAYDNYGFNQPVFSPGDTDKSGSLSGSEFAALYPEEDAPSVFKKLDVNANGELSQSEFESANLKEAAASAETAAPQPIK